MEKIYGNGIYDGIVIGTPFFEKDKKIDIVSYKIENIEQELERYDNAIKMARKKLYSLIDDLKNKVDKKDLQILYVHYEMLEDPMITEEIKKIIKRDKKNSESVVKSVIGEYIKIFEKKSNPMYQQRVADIKDIRDRIILALTEGEDYYKEVEGKIIITKEMFPSTLLDLVNRGIHIKGLIMEYSGLTSHVAILAKSLEIPTFMGGKNLFSIKWSDEIILDTYSSKAMIINNPNEETINKYKKLKEITSKEKEEIEKSINCPSVTLDNIKINLEFNAGQIIDEKLLKKVNPDGIGLLRTEILYMERESLPEEDEEIEFYKNIFDSLGKDKSITIRTLDIGADKRLPYCSMIREENPSLGERGIRFTLNHQEILKRQLRAIFRTAYDHEVKVMHPMVSTIEEIKKVRLIIEEIKKELEAEGKKFRSDIDTGIMVEVPSVIFMADELADELDFFSIGTNDLTQYILATDRFSQKENYLYDYYNPAVIRAINMIATVANKKNKKVSVCGEMAGELIGIVILLSFGIKNLSMSKTFIPRARNIIRKIKFNDMEELKSRIITAKDSEEVKEIAREFIKNL